MGIRRMAQKWNEKWLKNANVNNPNSINTLLILETPIF